MKEVKEHSVLNEVFVEASRAGDPSYSFKEGDKVVIGFLDSPKVEEVLCDEMVYKISYIETDKKTGVKTRHFRFVPWYSVRPADFIGKSTFTTNEDIKLYYSNITIESLLHKHLFASEGINFSPAYQREYVWENEDKERLLDSIFMGADIGKFTVRVLDDLEWMECGLSYEIIDGKQRFLTLLDYYLNRFPYKGVFFNDLSPKDRRTFLDHAVAWAEIRNLDEQATLRLFLMLNRGGRPVSDKVIEKVESLLEISD